jgi:hypothetical protein
MAKLLKIAIPTYNREEKLIQQLDFFKLEFERDIYLLNYVEFFVYDNSSTYDCRKLLYDYSKNNSWLNYEINKKNIGLVGNLNKIYLKSEALFTWAVGDDDNLVKGITNKIINCLDNNRDISFLFINHNAIDENTNIIKLDSAINLSSGKYINGKDILTKIFLFSKTTPMFISACVYDTKSIKEIINKKKSTYLVNPLEYSFYCSAKGPIYIIRDILIHNKWGNSSWKKEEINVMYYGVFNVLLSLKKYGYSNDQVSIMIREYLKSNLLMQFSKALKTDKLSIILIKYYNFNIIKHLFLVTYNRIKSK